MADADRVDLWSCLNALGRLHWQLGGRSVSEVWNVAREANGDFILPDNLVHLGGLVAALSADELRQVLVAAPGQPLSTDALSVLGAVDWRPDQLAVLVNTTLGVTEDPRTSRLRLYAEPQAVTALGSLLCGFSPGQLRQLFNDSRPHLVLETLAQLAVDTFGPTAGWSEQTVAAVGAAVAGLRRWQFKALTAEALRGLTPVAARRADRQHAGHGATPTRDSEHDHDHDHELEAVPEPSAEPRADDSTLTLTQTLTPSLPWRRPSSQESTQEQANSTAPARCRPALRSG
ncbi:putative stereocilin-like protein [Amphibalanus amphitrite]|uniref:Putative stereocilin-like protein n=1 Tax=Amphibalanus amphitrite TaxID=1232801 RepID=A0A6A4WBJ3_AMPAM|nr:putative stereocilin-like protein [Amphibalanus amphitrite]